MFLFLETISSYSSRCTSVSSLVGRTTLWTLWIYSFQPTCCMGCTAQSYVRQQCHIYYGRGPRTWQGWHGVFFFHRSQLVTLSTYCTKSVFWRYWLSIFRWNRYRIPWFSATACALSLAVIALEADSEGLNEELKEILRYYRAVVYLLPNDLCSKATTSIFCGSAEER